MSDHTLDLSAMSPMGRRRVCDEVARVSRAEWIRINNDLETYDAQSPAAQEMRGWRDGADAVWKRALRIKRES